MTTTEPLAVIYLQAITDATPRDTPIVDVMAGLGGCIELILAGWDAQGGRSDLWLAYLQKNLKARLQ